MSKEQHIDILARTLYGESVPNNIEDAQAIAAVVMNRVKLQNWPNTVKQTISSAISSIVGSGFMASPSPRHLYGVELTQWPALDYR